MFKLNIHRDAFSDDVLETVQFGSEAEMFQWFANQDGPIYVGDFQVVTE